MKHDQQGAVNACAKNKNWNRKIKLPFDMGFNKIDKSFKNFNVFDYQYQSINRLIKKIPADTAATRITIANQRLFQLHIFIECFQNYRNILIFLEI